MSGGVTSDPACPICAKPAAAPFRPFCCRRCADVDLGRWLADGYRVAGEDSAGDADAGGDPA